MPDPRFTTNVDDLDELLSVVDVDNIDDVETLLMALLERPLTVRESWNDDEQEPAIEVIVDSLGCISGYPLNVLELARGCAEVAGVGHYEGDPPGAVDASDVAELDDKQLIAALQEALGRVRLFNMMVDGEDGEIPE